MRTLERLFRRAHLPLAMSQGFHPKAKISSPSALALGIVGENEVLDIELSETERIDDFAGLVALLNRFSVPGLHFRSAENLGPQQGKARLAAGRFTMVVPEEERKTLPGRIEALLESPSFVVTKSNGKTVDVRSAIVSLRFKADTGKLETVLAANTRSHTGPEAGIRDLLTALDLEDRLFRTLFPVRNAVLLTDDLPNSDPEADEPRFDDR